MSLPKRIAFAVFITLAIAGAIWAYVSLKQSKKPKISAVSVMPDSCLVYLTTPDFFELNKKLNSQSLLIDKLKLFKEISKFCGTLQTVDSLLSSNEALQNEMTNNPVHFALYEDLNWLIAFNVKQLGDQNHVTADFLEVFHAKKIDAGLYAFRLNSAKYIYFALNSGVTLVSDSKEIISRSLNNSTAKLENNRSFREFKSTLEENSALSIYTDHRLCAANKAAPELNLSSVFKKGYSAGMIDLQPSQIAVNGFASCDSTEIISLLSNQQAQAPDFIDRLPLGTTSFTAYGFTSFAEVQKKKKKFFPATATIFWKQAGDSALYNLETDFYENADSYFVTFEMNTPQQNFVALNVNDTLKALEHLKFMSDSSVSGADGIIYKLNISQKEASQLFAPFDSHALHYAALYNSALFFSETAAGLQNLLSDLKKGSVMANDKSFAAYRSQNFPEAFNFLIYCAPNLTKESMHEFFRFTADPSADPYKNFRHFSFCVTNDASHFKFRWHLLNEAETMNNYPNVLWSVYLDQPSTVTAAQFINHVTHETEVMVQDDELRMYLINVKGNVLWRKILNEKIQSPVYVVDLFKNNKYQMLFSTQNYLHLIDRNGSYVKGYPVKLPAEASAPLSLFDYDNDKDYRLLIPCKNKTIYNYSLSGTKQDGFAPVKTESEVRLPVQYIKVGASDYLVAVDAEGKIYTFSRRGAGRIGLTNRTVENCNAFYVDATNNINSTFLVYADDKNSLINKISFSDRKEIVQLNSDMNNAQVSFALMDENRTMDVLFTKPSTITAYDLNGNLLFEKNQECDFSKGNFYGDESRAVVYAWSEANKEVSIIPEAGGKIQRYKATAMPMICELFNDSKKYLIITNNKRLNCVLLN